jgi:hypothetical protein
MSIGAALFGLAVVGAMALPMVPWWRVSSQFLTRPAEAKPLIEALYLRHYDTGDWPDDLHALPPAIVTSVPPDWQYLKVDDGDRVYPVLRLRGPLHMRLEYAFREGGDLRAPGGWTAKGEGDRLEASFPEPITPRPAD